jgi:hypothetical protein
MGAVGAAMAAGSCALLVGAAAANPSMKKMYKKKASKAIRQVGDMLDDVQDLFK